jgi:hypothetical protein
MKISGWISVCAAAVIAASSVATFATNAVARSDSNHDPDPKFDRLDGTGKSRKRVDVIEWEDNLEIHVYPAGSLRGLALKLDKKPGSNDKVMVIGYRFDNQPGEQLVRRAILGIPLREGFKVFKDPTADDYDKIVISNNGLARPLVAYRTEGEPGSLYPDGHPANQRGVASSQQEEDRASDESQTKRQPARASQRGERQFQKQVKRRPVAEEPADDYESEGDSRLTETPEEDGRIQPFFMKRKGSQGRTTRGRLE